MPRIPGAESVERVPVPRDPGLRVPEGIFGQEEADALSELGGGLLDIAASVEVRRQRLQKLDDANAYTQVTNALSRSIAEETVRFNQEEDLANPGISQRYVQSIDRLIVEARAGVTAELSPEGEARLQAAVEGLKTSALKSFTFATGTAVENKAIDLIDATNQQLTTSLLSAPDGLDAAVVTWLETMAGYADTLGSNLERDRLESGLSNIVVAAIRGHVNQGNFDKAEEVLADERFEDVLSLDQRDRLISFIESAEDDAKLKQGIELEADFILDIDSELRGDNPDFDALEAKVVGADLKPGVAARQIIMVRNERDRREQELTEGEEKAEEEIRKAKLALLHDEADRGVFTNADLDAAVADDVVQTGAEWLSLRKDIRAGLPAFARVERNAETIAANRGLFDRVLNNEVSLEELDAIQQAALLSDATSEQIEFLDNLAGVIRQRAGGVSGQKDNEVYINIVERIRKAKIEFTKGKLKSVDASVTELMLIQRDIVMATRLGDISNDEAQTFLTKIMPALEKRVSEETGIPGFLGFGGGAEDVYDIGFQAMINLLEKNGQEDDTDLKAFLFRTFIVQADAAGLDQMEPGSEKLEAAQEAIARKISAAYAGAIEPALRGLSPDSLPNSVFVNGRVFNIFGGLSGIPTAQEVGGLETRRLQDGRVVQLIKGTNIIVAISDVKPTGPPRGE